MICFLKIITSNKLLKFKFLSIFYYILFSLPYIYLIILWGGLIPSSLLEGRKLGNEIFLEHIDQFHKSGTSIHDENGHYFTVDDNFRKKLKELNK